MKEYKKVAVIMGGSSAEREVSLLSGNPVLKSLQGSGINAYKFDPHESPLCELKQHGFDCAVIMLHGRGGEDGAIQGALECMQIPYTGSGVLASALGMDKHKTKLIWQNAGIPLAKWICLNKKTYDEQHLSKLKIDLPVVVKPVNEGSTFGLSKVYDIEDLSTAVNLAFEYDDAILIEELIIGGEFTVTVFNNEVYPLIKIEAPNGDYDYKNKYFTDETKYICPYDLGEILNRQVEKFSLLGYEAIGASGVARIDFMVNQHNELFFLEINTLPGMTGHSLVPIAFQAVGDSFDALCLKVLNDARLHHFSGCV